MKVSELAGAALDYAVAQAVGLLIGIYEGVPFLVSSDDDVENYNPSTNWAHGGPLIDQFDIDVGKARNIDYATGEFYAVFRTTNLIITEYADAKLIAICRAVVTAKLGENVEIPQELLV